MLDGCVSSCLGAPKHQRSCKIAGLLEVIGALIVVVVWRAIDCGTGPPKRFGTCLDSDSTERTFVFMTDDIMSALMSHCEYLMPNSHHL